MSKVKLYIVFVVMAGLISGGFFMLANSEQVVGKGITEEQPTAYIEGNETKVSFKLDGRIEELLVEEGDVVKEGQVLGYLQNDELKAKVKQAEAAVQVAEGKISEASGAELIAEAKKEQGSAAVSVTAQTADKKITQANAAVKAAEANLQALQNGARPEEISQAESQLKATEEIQKIAKTNLDRLQTLLDEGVVSQADVDKVNTSYQEANAKYEAAKQQYQMAVKGPRQEEITAAKAQVEQAKAALELAKASKQEVAVRQGDVKAAQAGIEQAEGAVDTAMSGKQQAEAALAEAKVYLSYTELIAPTDGIIKTKAASVGELVGSGFPVFTLEAEENRWSTFYFPETDVIGLNEGEAVKMELVASSEKLTGTIVSIAPAADFAIQKATKDMDDTDIRSFQVKVEYKALPDKIKTGMTVKWLHSLGEQDGK